MVTNSWQFTFDTVLTYEAVADRYPMWTEANILELRMQFQTLDVKQDGLIDFHEL